jgi:predicted RNA-binding protein (virulence factor B family)
LLPLKYLPPEFDQTLSVFVYLDSEDRIVATTEIPLIQVGEFAALQVVSMSPLGAFLNWGLSKDLFLPFAEQTWDLRPGDDVLVYAYIDNTGRIAASQRTDRFVAKTSKDFQVGEKVELLISGKTDLGFKAIINGKVQGVLYANEVFEPLRYAQKISGYIKNLREDGKIDLSLQALGMAAADEVSVKILDFLKLNDGFMEFNDKTSAELISRYFGVSRKKFKIALGGLYKRRMVTVDEDGTRLVLPAKK